MRFALRVLGNECIALFLAEVKSLVESRLDAVVDLDVPFAQRDALFFDKCFDALAFFIDDDPRCTVMEMRAKARRIKAQYGEIGLIVVDYLQLMSSNKRIESRQVEVSELSRGLKILAREMQAPVMALSQLNRQLEYRTDKRPMLADLRESGSIEQDADVVLFIYRDDYYNQDSEQRGVAEIIVAKHRGGPTGTVRLAFIDKFTKFADMARE